MSSSNEPTKSNGQYHSTKGNIVEAVRHARAVMSDIRKASAMNDEELYAFAKEIGAPYHLLKETARLKRLPVVSFAAGGIATPGE